MAESKKQKITDWLRRTLEDYIYGAEEAAKRREKDREKTKKESEKLTWGEVRQKWIKKGYPPAPGWFED